MHVASVNAGSEELYVGDFLEVWFFRSPHFICLSIAFFDFVCGERRERAYSVGGHLS